MEAACEKEGIRFYRPSPIFCTDNAAMIGVAAYYEYQKGTRHGWDLNAVPNRSLENDKKKKLPQQNGEERSAAEFLHL